MCLVMQNYYKQSQLERVSPTLFIAIEGFSTGFMCGARSRTACDSFWMLGSLSRSQICDSGNEAGTLVRSSESDLCLLQQLPPENLVRLVRWVQHPDQRLS